MIANVPVGTQTIANLLAWNSFTAPNNWWQNYLPFSTKSSIFFATPTLYLPGLGLLNDSAQAISNGLDLLQHLYPTCLGPLVPKAEQ
jgi:hypothetical protein